MGFCRRSDNCVSRLQRPVIPGAGSSRGHHIADVLVTALLFFVALFSPALVLADSISVYGLPFEADEIVQVDSANVRVTIGADSQIVPKGDTQRLVVERTMTNSSRARRISLNSLEQFVETAISSADTRMAALGLRGIIYHAETEADQVLSYFMGFQQKVDAADLIKAALEEVPTERVPEELYAKLVVAVAVQDTRWVEARYSKCSEQLRAHIRDEVTQAVLNRLRQREFEDIDALLGLLRALLGEDTPAYRDLHIFSSRLQEALTRMQRGELDPLLSLTEVSKDNKEFSTLVGSFAIDAVDTQVMTNLQKGEITKALLLLSRFNFEGSTERIRELTLRTLRQLEGSEETPLSVMQVDQYLRKCAENDSEMRAGYIAALERQISYLIKSGRVDMVGESLSKLVAIRPDPSPGNDAMRVAQAFGFLNRGMRVSARECLEDLQTPISFLNQIKLTYSGYYGDPLNWILILLMPLIVVLVIWVRERAPVLFPSKPIMGILEDEVEDDESDRPAGFAIVGNRLMTPSMQEYNRCLETLGLKSGASLRQIKSQYRSLIKKVHPDLNEKLSALERERFVTLTKTYDRLIELRRELRFQDS